MVAVSSDAEGQELQNQIVGSGDGIDADGNAILDSAGNVLSAQDASDSGIDASSGNGNASTSDPTPVDIPLVDFPLVPGDLDDDTTSGSPAVLLGVPPIFISSIGNFIGSPGPIYSGIPTNTTNPVTLESNAPITGGYSIDNADFGGSIQQGDCCGEIVDAIPGQPVFVDTVPVEQVIEGDCGCDAVPAPAVFVEQPVIETPCDACCDGGQGQVVDEIIRFDGPAPVSQPGFLQRFRGWLHR